MKKLCNIFLVLLLLLGGFSLAADNNLSTLDDAELYPISPKIKKEVKEAISAIYGKENTEDIYSQYIKHVDSAIKSRPKDLVQQDKTRKDDWYKDEIIYMFYVDQFGTITDEKKNTFKDTETMFSYLQDLGVTTLYLLPFADSPMKDAGFDVKNPKNVRQDLGGMVEFKDFIKEAKKRNFKIKADLVLNHFSSEHEWFKRLENGDKSALDYFIYRRTMPKYTKYKDEKLGTFIEYVEDNGKISKRRLIFSDNVENNWTKVNVAGEDYYLYHTFYPFQLDINWQNPNVLYYVLDIITNWTNLGIDIFRMDAIPYLSKDAGTSGENQPKTHSILTLLSDYIQLTAPSTVIQVEACEMPKDILPYFGTERTVEVDVNNEKKELNRTTQAQIAYHFPYMPALWASLISEDKKYFFDAVKDTPQIPNSTTWGIFLRLHDELTLEMTTPEVRKIVFDGLVNKGMEFRTGFGVSGRMANFLDKNPDRIEQAFSILLSLPGVPIIYYGDEVGAANNFKNAKEYAQIRAKEQNKKMHSNLLSTFDSRDIHRGKIPQKLFYGSTKGYYEFNSKIYKRVKHLIALRKSLEPLYKGSFIPVKTASKSNFAYIRKTKDKQILVINNISKDKLTAVVTLPTDIVLKNKGHIKSIKNLINGDNIKVNISIQNRTMHLRLAPYQVLWLEL